MHVTVARSGAARSAIGATLLLGAWLFLAAIPVLADGGPHVAAVNSGVSSLTADGCAGCHRAHTAQGAMLLNTPEEDLCLACHGAASTGATTSVEDGIQYAIDTANGLRDTAVLGALRSGGFVNAAINSGNAARQLVSSALSSSDDQLAKVRVRVDGLGAVDVAPVTSAHLNLASNGLTAPAVAWGNGDIGLGLTGPGPTVTLGCASCHNPHGNGQYRILNPVPVADGAGFDPVPTLVVPAPAIVADSPVDNPDPAESDTKNYTVIQVKGTGTPPAITSFLLYADDVIDAGYAQSTGDYWHVRVPWNSTSGSNDAPNGRPANAVGGVMSFNTQMTTWCTACHTRYYETTGDTASGDALFAYRHETIGNRACTTCHVAHGSNAAMDGVFSSTFMYPDAPGGAAPIASDSSRLLKVDNRGTCQLCHDPTSTAYPANPYTGPLPVPGVP